MSDETTVRTALRRAATSVDVPDRIAWREALGRRRTRRRRATWAAAASVVAVAVTIGAVASAHHGSRPRRVVVMQPVESAAPAEPTQTTASATAAGSAPSDESPPGTVVLPGSVPPVETSRWTAIEDPPLTIGPEAIGALAGGEYVVWDGSSTAEQAAAWSPTTGWRTIAESPLSQRTSAMAVPAGDRLIVWGGMPVERDAGADVWPDGAIYDPATDAWTPIPSTTATGTPLTADDGVAVWTGTELLVWASEGLGSRAAAYDPATGTWRTTTPSPLTLRSHVAGAWTGTELIVWGGISHDADGAFAGNPDDGAAYDPTTDTWRVLPPAPMVGAVVDAAWTGSEVLFTPGYSGDPAGTVTARSGGGSYDPATDSWSPVTWLGQHPGSAIVVVGERVLIMAKGGTTVHDLADGSTVELSETIVGADDGDDVGLIDGPTVASFGSAGAGSGGSMAVGLLGSFQTDARHPALLTLP